MDDQYKLIVETHGMVKELKGRMDSLNCAKNEKEMYCMRLDHQKLEKRFNSIPSKTWGIILGIIMLLLTAFNVFGNKFKG